MNSKFSNSPLDFYKFDKQNQWKTVTAEEFYTGIKTSDEEDKTVNPKLVQAVEEITGMFGEDARLGDVKSLLLGKKKHRCPKCHGKGYTEEEYNSYPTDLPDSGFVYKPAWKKITCDLCNGEGWLEKEMKPKYKKVFDGYECIDDNNE